MNHFILMIVGTFFSSSYLPNFSLRVNFLTNESASTLSSTVLMVNSGVITTLDLSLAALILSYVKYSP